MHWFGGIVKCLINWRRVPSSTRKIENLIRSTLGVRSICWVRTESLPPLRRWICCKHTATVVGSLLPSCLTGVNACSYGQSADLIIVNLRYALLCSSGLRESFGWSDGFYISSVAPGHCEYLHLLWISPKISSRTTSASVLGLFTVSCMMWLIDPSPRR